MCLTLKQICTWIKSLRQSFGILKKKKRNYQSDGKKKKKREKENSFIALPGKGSQRAKALQTVCPHPPWRSFYSNGSKGLISSGTFFWWVGREVSRSLHSSICFQLVWGLCACGQQALLWISYPSCWGFHICKSWKVLSCVSIDGNQDFAPRRHHCFPWVFLPDLAAPPFPN